MTERKVILNEVGQLNTANDPENQIAETKCSHEEASEPEKKSFKSIVNYARCIQNLACCLSYIGIWTIAIVIMRAPPYSEMANEPLVIKPTFTDMMKDFAVKPIVNITVQESPCVAEKG